MTQGSLIVFHLFRVFRLILGKVGRLIFMKHLLSGVLIISLAGITPAHASKTIPYKNQRAGQFCKTIDIKKSVTLPDGAKLKCTKDGSRARWKAK